MEQQEALYINILNNNMKPKDLFLNKELNRNWSKHMAYFKTIKRLRDAKEMINKEEAVLGVENKILYVLTINETPYFYLLKLERDIDENIAKAWCKG